MVNERRILYDSYKKAILPYLTLKIMSRVQKSSKTEEYDKLEKSLVRLLHSNGFRSSRDQCLVLYKLAMKLSSEDGTHCSKITNGTMPELIACMALDLEWNNSTVHGHDAVDSEGRHCEIKTFAYKRKGKHKININYHPPPIKDGEDKEDYIKRVEIWISSSTGGHFWVAMSARKTKVHRSWFIESDKLAKVVGEKIRRKCKNIDKNINFGCFVCPDCFGLHRLDVITKQINEKSMMPKRVSTSCGRK